MDFNLLDRLSYKRFVGLPSESIFDAANRRLTNTASSRLARE